MTMLQTIESSIIEIRDVPVILDADVAALYGVETKHVNQAVRNNPDRFPDGYVFQLTREELDDLRSKISTLNDDKSGNAEPEILRSKISTSNRKGEEEKHESLRSKFLTLNDDKGDGREQEILRSKFLTSSWGGQRHPPKAFTEQGLYMLATILKSSKATQTTLAIIETFTKMRRLGRSVKELAEVKTDAEKKQLMQKTGEIITDIFADELEPLESETTVELNFALFKVKHIVRRDRKKKKS